MQTEFLGIPLFEPQDAVTRENFNTVLTGIDTAAHEGFPGQNLLINSDFQIWQRGESIGCGSGKTYTADRWMSTVSGSLQNNVSRGQQGEALITLNRNALRFSQLVELTDQLKIKIQQVGKLTFSFDCKASESLTGLSARIGNTAFSYDAGTDWARKSFTLTVSQPLSGTSLEAALLDCAANQFASATVSFRRVKLEISGNASSYAAKTCGEELNECLRYYERIGGSSYAPIAVTYQFPGSYFGVGMISYYPKRTVPDIKMMNADNYCLLESGERTRVLSEITIEKWGTLDLVSNNRAVLETKLNVAGSSGVRIQLLLPKTGSTNAYIEVDSELYS